MNITPGRLAAFLVSAGVLMVVTQILLSYRYTYIPIDTQITPTPQISISSWDMLRDLVNDDASETLVLRKSTFPGEHQFIAVLLNPMEDISISGPFLRDGKWEEHNAIVFHDLFKQHFGNDKKRCRVIDVGSNLGLFALYYASHGCHVDCFETQPRLMKRLEVSLKINGLEESVKLHTAAVSNETGKTFWTETTRGDINPGGQPISENKNLFRYPIPVSSIRLDSLDFPEQLFYIKIDVEGHEYQALKGASGLLSNAQTRPLYISIEVRKDRVSVDSVKYLLSMGYTCELILPVWGAEDTFPAQKVITGDEVESLFDAFHPNYYTDVLFRLV